MKYKGSLFRNGKRLFPERNLKLQEADTPSHRPMGFRAPSVTLPKLVGELLIERPWPDIKTGESLSLVLNDGRKADAFICDVAEIDALYFVRFNLKSEFT